MILPLNSWASVGKIPTKEQWQELIDKCTWTYNKAASENGYVYCWTVTGENGNKIYLPMYNYYNRIPSTATPSTTGCYWTSSEYDSDEYGWLLELGTSSKRFTYLYKYYHMSIRPVLVK
ncbi:MAG: hypothetical protein LUD00_13930 [Prevotellaceae bacterium]|nr:hypothetical protein [Prevotellaceae bacterium]